MTTVCKYFTSSRFFPIGKTKQFITNKSKFATTSAHRIFLEQPSMIISGKLFRITPHLHLALAWKPNKYVRDYPQSLCASLHTVTGAHTWMKSPCVRRKPSRSFSGQIRGRGSRAPRFCRYFLDNVLLCYLQVCWPVCSEHGLTILHKNDAKILQVHTQNKK